MRARAPRSPSAVAVGPSRGGLMLAADLGASEPAQLTTASRPNSELL
jgi:hypothetical protein